MYVKKRRRRKESKKNKKWRRTLALDRESKPLLISLFLAVSPLVGQTSVPAVVPMSVISRNCQREALLQQLLSIVDTCMAAMANNTVAVPAD